ncbi:hypothetical protein BDW69DRAFT_179829 [Aspergillus filifer]
MAQQIIQPRTKGNESVPDSKNLFALSAAESKRLIRSLVASHMEGTMVAGSRILFLSRCYEHLASISQGKTDLLELMRRDKLLDQYYYCLQDKHKYQEFLQPLGHLRPRMNVPEIGAGTGGLTAIILDFLWSFFVSVRERFHDRSRIKYALLDISQDPTQQEFPASHYDSIIAFNEPAETGQPSPAERIESCFKIDQLHVWFVLGLVAEEEDDRAAEPYILPENGVARLRDADFSGIDASALDAEYPCQPNAMILARSAPEFQTRPVTLLCMGSCQSAATAAWAKINQRLSCNGYKVDTVGWGRDLPAD